MQLSVLILESSFSSFFSPSLLHNLFLFRSALICAVVADDKTGHIRLFSALFTSFVLALAAQSFVSITLQKNLREKGKNFTVEFFIFLNFFLSSSHCNSLEVLC